MKHIPQDKYNVAWFTLAECIARREKVRALGVYRLLSHSIEDRAYRSQLEGDILLAFQDDFAIPKYKEAAYLYQQSGKLLEALAIYEHLHTLDATESDYLNELIRLYGLLNFTTKKVHCLKKLFPVLLRSGQLDTADGVLKQLDSALLITETTHEREQLVFALIRENKSRNSILDHLHTLIDAFLQRDDTNDLQRFVSTLEALNAEYHQEACSLLHDQDL